MSAVIQLRRATAAAWTAANSLLAEGEFGYETDTAKMKIGDGATLWNALAYWSTGGGGGVTGSGTAGTLPVWTGAAAIGDSGALQVAGPVTGGEFSVGVNALAADVSTLCAAGGALVAGQTFANVAAPHAAVVAWSKDNAASMVGAGTGYEFWGTYYDAVTPAPFRLASILAQSEANATHLTSTWQSSLHFMAIRNGIMRERLSFGYDRAFRFYDQSSLSAGELTATGFLPGQYFQIGSRAGSPGEGARLSGAGLKGDWSGLEFNSFLHEQPITYGTSFLFTAGISDGSTGISAVADDARMVTWSNPNYDGGEKVIMYGNGDVCTIGNIAATAFPSVPPVYHLQVSKVGVVNVNTDFAALENLYFDCTMLATETGLVFRQKAYAGGTEPVLDAARISFRCDDTWASDPTESGSLNFWTINAGYIGRKLSINSLGALYGYCPVVLQSLTANEQTAFGCGALDTYHISPVTLQGGLLSSVFVAAASAHNWGFAWSSLLGDEPVIASHLFDTAKHDGTGGLVAVAAGSLLLDVRNYNGSKFSVAGNGDIAWSGTATGTIDGGGA